MSLAIRFTLRRTMPTCWRRVALSITTGLFVAMSICTRVQAAAPDYGKGFDLLFELGLPDVSGSGWEYVSLTGRNGGDSIDDLLEAQDGADGKITQALQKSFSHGWVEKPPDASKQTFRRLMVNGLQLQGIAEDEEGWRAMQQAGLQWTEQKPGTEAADEKADALALAKGLQAIQGMAKAKEAMVSYQRDYLVTAFFRAAHYHRRGHKDEAAAAAQALFAIVPRPERLLDLLVQKIAETRYQTAIATFDTTGDWKALDGALASQLATFTRGWMVRPLIERLHKQVQKRIAHLKAPALEHASDLTPEQAVWWQEVADGKPGSKEDSEPNSESEDNDGACNMDQIAQAWLFHLKMNVDPQMLEATRKAIPKRTEWMAHILSKDWDWITVMAAALKDETLVYMLGSRYYGNSSGEFELAEEAPELNEEELEEAWQQLPRPMTRGDIARAFLSTVIPVNREEGEEVPEDAEEFRTLALECAKALKGKSPLETGTYYLASGVDDQKSQAMLAVSQAGGEAENKVVEGMILEKPSSHFGVVTKILQKRKETGKALLEQFRKATEQEYAQRQGGEGKEGLPSYVKEQFKALEAFVSGKGAADFIADYVAGKTSLNQLTRQIQALSPTGEAAEKLVDQILAGVLRVPKDKGERKGQLLMMTVRFVNGMPDARKAALRKILQEDGAVPVDSRDGTFTDLANYVYWVADHWGNEDQAKLQQQLQGIDIADLWPLWSARGKAVLDGTPLPETPSSASVSATRRQEMLQAVDQHVEKGWPEYVQALPLNEKMALQEELKKADFKPAWQGLAQRVTQIRATPEKASQLEPVRASLNQTVSAASLIKLSELCRASAGELGEGHGMRIYISPLPLLQGLRIHIQSGGNDADESRSMIYQAGNWLRQAATRQPDAPPVKAYSWMRWAKGLREILVANWHLDKDSKWQNWATTDNEDLGQAPASGEPVAEADISKSLEEAIQAWTPDKGSFWIETGVVKTPAPKAPAGTSEEGEAVDPF